LSSEKCGVVVEVVADGDFGERIKIRGVGARAFSSDKAIRQEGNTSNISVR
jgi:hypothetical protein